MTVYEQKNLQGRNDILCWICWVGVVCLTSKSQVKGRNLSEECLWNGSFYWMHSNFKSKGDEEEKEMVDSRSRWEASRRYCPDLNCFKKWVLEYPKWWELKWHEDGKRICVRSMEIAGDQGKSHLLHSEKVQPMKFHKVLSPQWRSSTSSRVSLSVLTSVHSFPWADPTCLITPLWPCSSGMWL